MQDLPKNRDIVRKFEGGVEDTIPYSALKANATPLPSKYALYGADLNQALVTCRVTSGWLCMEYSDAFQSLHHDLTAHEASGFDDSSVQSFMKQVRQLQVDADLGLTRDELRRFLSRNKIATDEMCSRLQDRFPLMSNCVALAFRQLLSAFHLWNAELKLTNIQFIGGGFGVVGSAKGMLTAIGMQSLVDSRNRNISIAREREVQAVFQCGISKLSALVSAGETLQR